MWGAQMAVYYFFSPRVTRSVVYGAAARNRLDIHRPPASQAAPEGGVPVVIYITGESPLSVGNLAFTDTYTFPRGMTRHRADMRGSPVCTLSAVLLIDSIRALSFG